MNKELKELVETITEHLNDIKRLDAENVKYSDEVQISLTLAIETLKEIKKELKNLKKYLDN